MLSLSLGHTGMFLRTIPTPQMSPLLPEGEVPWLDMEPTTLSFYFLRSTFIFLLELLLTDKSCPDVGLFKMNQA